MKTIRIIAGVLMGALIAVLALGPATALAGNTDWTKKHAEMWGSNRKTILVPFTDRIGEKKSMFFIVDGVDTTADRILFTAPSTSRIRITEINYWNATGTGDTDPSGGNGYTITLEESSGTDVEIGTSGSLVAALPLVPTQLDATLTNTVIPKSGTIALTITDAGTAVVINLGIEVQYEAIAADLSARVLWEPQEKVEIKGIYYVGWGTMTAAAATNDLVFTVQDEANNAIITMTRTSAITADTPTSLGDLSADADRLLNVGEQLELTITANGTSICPDFMLQIDYVLQDS